MITRNVSLLLAALLAVALSGCLRDEEHVVGTPGTGGTSAVSGSGGAASPPTGSGGAAQLLSIAPEEAVSRLVQVLWNIDAPPEFVRQHAPEIGDRAAVRALAAQMLEDPMAGSPVGAFYRWWLDLNRIPLQNKDAALFPAWTTALAADMARETETFGVNITLKMDGTLTTLLTAPFSYVNDRLAAIYGLGGGFGADLQFAMLNSKQRGGILTQPGLHALTSAATRNSPTHRGQSVWNTLLCLQVPPPPQGVSMTIGADDLANSGQTLREWLTEHRANPACAACHLLVDPMGFAFEGFDAIGRARLTDNGQPVDLTGTFPNDSTARPFNGPVELGNLLATSGQVQECMVKQWMTFMLGRALRDRDDPSVAEARAAFAGSGFRLRTIISAVAGTEAFLAP